MERLQNSERRVTRVSEAQWHILLEFLEANPQLARGYNNSSQGRTTSKRLWQELANKLNSEGSGTTKTFKDWSVYVSNYKSKIKKNVAGIRRDSSGTGGGPPLRCGLNDNDNRFLALMGPGFGQAAPQVQVEIFLEDQLPSTSNTPRDVPDTYAATEPPLFVEDYTTHEKLADAEGTENLNSLADVPAPPPNSGPTLPRRSRRSRYRCRPLAPLDETRRVLSQVEAQRAAADAAKAEAIDRLAGHLGRLADAQELVGRNLGRIADITQLFLQNK